jgi:hypothetical protein
MVQTQFSKDILLAKEMAKAAGPWQRSLEDMEATSNGYIHESKRKASQSAR